MGSSISDINSFDIERFSTRGYVTAWAFGETRNETTISNRFGVFGTREIGSYSEWPEEGRESFSGEIEFVRMPLIGDAESVVLTYIDGVLRDKRVQSLPA